MKENIFFKNLDTGDVMQYLCEIVKIIYVLCTASVQSRRVGLSYLEFVVSQCSRDNSC